MRRYDWTPRGMESRESGAYYWADDAQTIIGKALALLKDGATFDALQVLEAAYIREFAPSDPMFLESGEVHCEVSDCKLGCVAPSEEQARRKGGKR